MSYIQPSLLPDSLVDRELADARRLVDHQLSLIRSFSVVHQDEPWRHLDDLLAELRAAAVTVAVLEDLVAKRP